jgi:hypothetical protein
MAALCVVGLMILAMMILAIAASLFLLAMSGRAARCPPETEAHQIHAEARREMDEISDEFLRKAHRCVSGIQGVDQWQKEKTRAS